MGTQWSWTWRLVLALCAAASVAVSQVSPFEDVDWTEGSPPDVMVSGEWWELVSIHGVDFGDLYGFALSEYGGDEGAQKRIDEDLLDVLEGVGATRPTESVSLGLRPLRGGEVVVLDAVPMTLENRQRLWQMRSNSERSREMFAERNAPDSFSRDTAHSMLDSIGQLLKTRHSYSIARGVNVDALIERAKGGLTSENVDRYRFARAIERVLAQSGDAHAGIGGRIGSDAGEFDTGGGLPFAVMPLELEAGGRVVAVVDEGRRFLDTRYPYLVAIDGVDVERWLEIASEVVQGGSPASRRYGACREMRRMGWIRERLGLALDPEAVVTLEDDSGRRREQRVSTRSAHPSGYRHSSRQSSGRAQSGIAYIPIPQMLDPDRPLGGPRERAEFEKIERDVRRARGARALILDVRGNFGGTRDVLHLVASWLMAPDDPPVVYSAARALMWDGRDPARVREQFESRYLFPVDSDRWNEAERQAVDRFVEGFRPEVELSDERFGPLHVSVLSPGGSGEGNLAGKPVVVLMDETCISATDVFLAAMRELPGVTLIGRPSRGASGMTEEHFVSGDAGPILIRLASMVSFMPDGRVFDWHGVAPDVLAELRPEDFRRNGNDTALELANEHLRRVRR